MIKDLLCNSSNSLFFALDLINQNSKGSCFVVDSSNHLVGVLTDGDIRRALLQDIKLDQSVDNVISKEFSYAHKDDTYEVLVSKISNEIQILPIVDDEMKVIDYFEYRQNIHYPVASPHLYGNEFKYLVDAFMSSWISSTGKYINEFENAFASYCKVEYGISCSNGTSAIHLALLALEIGEGDEVIIPDLTFAATINAVLHSNATPVIVDIEEDSWCIDPVAIEKNITTKTKAIIPVHLYGQVCNMTEILRLSNKYNLKVIEDCAEAHGASFNSMPVGSMGDIGCFSFYANKVITTGEGGMCITNDHYLKNRLEVLRDHGMSRTKKYWHDTVGYNYRMTNLQASIGLAQLERIDSIHEGRRFCEDEYKRILNPEKFIFQKDLENRQRITWLTSILLTEYTQREQFEKFMRESKIDTRPFFYPLSSMEIYKQFSKKTNAISKEISKKGINLPTYENKQNFHKITQELRMFYDSSDYLRIN